MDITQLNKERRLILEKKENIESKVIGLRKKRWNLSKKRFANIKRFIKLENEIKDLTETQDLLSRYYDTIEETIRKTNNTKNEQVV